MGFIRNLLRNREKHQLEEALLASPTPAAFLRLARLYQDEGDLPRARQIAKRGAAKFPDSTEIGSAQEDLVRLDRQAECKRLRERVINYPNPRLYARLAELYRAGGEAQKAQQVAEAGARTYPNNGGLLYVLGELANDAGRAEEACDHLTKATEQDSYNYSALKTLGQVLGKLGRYAEAVATFKKILAFAPHDEKAKELYNQAVEATRATAAPTQAMETAEIKAAAEDEEQSSSPSADTKVLGEEETAQILTEAGDLDAAVSELAGSAGVDGALLVDNYGLAVASALPAGMEENLAAAMVTGLRRSASPACGEMGLGAFEELAVELDSGSLYVYALREMTLAVFAAAGAKAGLLERCVHQFAEKVLDLH